MYLPIKTMFKSLARINMIVAVINSTLSNMIECFLPIFCDCNPPNMDPDKLPRTKMLAFYIKKKEKKD